MENRIEIAFLQLLPTKSVKENMEKGIHYCKEAKKQGADIALFPEMWSCGYHIPHDMDQLNELAIPVDGEFVTCYAKLAKELNMAIGITFLERCKSGLKNTICLYDRHGKSVYKYSKVHICNFNEADDESVLCAGDEFIVAELGTAKGNVKVGSMICYDREFPESARILMLKGAELVLVPNACPMEINRLSQLRGRAYENMFAIATCNYPTPHPDCNGHSTLFDGVVYLPELSGSRDTCILETDESEGVFLAELDLNMLREFRKREHQNLKNRRPELYGILARCYIDLREKPQLKDSAAEWFHSKWGVATEAYLACMEAYLNRETEYGWYLCLDDGNIVGGLGVIENDFHDRKDLTPNVCAVYTEEKYRCKGIAGHLLDMVVNDLKTKGITPVYLITDHIGFYERYGWEFLCMVQGDGEPDLTRMYIHR